MLHTNAWLLMIWKVWMLFNGYWSRPPSLHKIDQELFFFFPPIMYSHFKNSFTLKLYSHPCIFFQVYKNQHNVFGNSYFGKGITLYNEQYLIQGMTRCQYVREWTIDQVNLQIFDSNTENFLKSWWCYKILGQRVKKSVCLNYDFTQ